MIAAIFAVAVAVASQASPPATTSSQPPANTLREVVYNVWTSVRVDALSENCCSDDAPVPASSGRAGNHGTVTVDVIGQLSDGSLEVKVIEQWTNLLRPLTNSGAVLPDGSIVFGAFTINDVTRELLPYFATQFAPVSNLDTSTTWTRDDDIAGGLASSRYTVTKVDGHTVSLHLIRTIKALNKATADGTVDYDAVAFVPISGHIVKQLTESTDYGEATGTLDLRFERVSDTGMPASSPPP
jgi:hypothetical protein